MISLLPRPPARRLRWLAPYAAGSALLAIMLLLSPQFGYTWDERVQQWYGEQIWGYLHGDVPAAAFETALSIQDVNIQFLYSGLVEVIAVSVQHLLGIDTYVARHAVDALLGWLGIVWCGRLAARLFGPRAGWLAAALLVLSPRYFGDAMNNSKDVPFAAFTVIALYYILSFSDRPPFLTWKQAAKLAAAIALAINVRPIGLILIPFSVAVLAGFALRALLTAGAPRPWRGAIVGSSRLLAAALVALPLGTLFWPWAQVHPFTRPIEAFLALSGGADWTAGYPVLYAGEDISAGTLPWHYLPVWLAISTPPVILAGLAAVPLLFRRPGSRRVALGWLGVFAFAPFAAAVIRRPNMYDGMRQFLFLIPPLFVLSACAWIAVVDRTRGRVRIAAMALLAAGLAEPLLFQIRNHPNQPDRRRPARGVRPVRNGLLGQQHAAGG
jgi:4-amino-4-deoxy-L-arabinose transferase-like glycosyltransferase